ncbi:MAG: DUF3379 domain-containing protein [Pirellulaceae bacterium]|nr:DUF3379 domain-containing protein [Pirellulaceae bacterium]
MMTNQEIQQAIDACRPGSDDLQRPEMAALADAIRQDPDVRRRYESSQQFDASVRGLFRDVPVPAGLADRLLAAIEPPRDRAAAESQTLVAPLLSEHDVRKHAEEAGGWPHRKRRRMWLTMAGSLTAAAALAGFLLLVPYFSVTEPRPDDRLPGEILAWADAVVRQGWNEDLQTAQSLRRPLDRAVRANPQRWCSITTAYDSQTIVYDVAPRGADMALVFCMQCPVRSSRLPDMPPWNAFSATGGLTLGVWRRGDMVYVLVVRGGPRRYRELIEASPLIGLLLNGRPFSLTATA